jgi:WD40 repeat protein
VQGKKVIPTTCTYSRDGSLIAAACQNGSIQIWDRNLTVSQCLCFLSVEYNYLPYKDKHAEIL